MVEAPKENQAPAMPNDPAIMGVCGPLSSLRRKSSGLEDEADVIFAIPHSGSAKAILMKRCFFTSIRVPCSMLLGTSEQTERLANTHHSQRAHLSNSSLRNPLSSRPSSATSLPSSRLTLLMASLLARRSSNSSSSLVSRDPVALMASPAALALFQVTPWDLALRRLATACHPMALLLPAKASLRLRQAHSRPTTPQCPLARQASRDRRCRVVPRDPLEASKVHPSLLLVTHLSRRPFRTT